MPPKPYRHDFNYSYIFGIYPVLELLTLHPDLVTHVFFTSKIADSSGITKVADLCTTHHIPSDISDSLLTKLTKSDNAHVLAVFNKFYPDLDPSANHVVLVNPSDSGNLGTIIRTMVAFDFLNLAVIRPSVDIFDPRVLRASMGSLFHLRFSYFSDFVAYQSTFTRHYYPLMTNATTDLRLAKLAPPYSLIFGSEGPGLSVDFAKIGTPLKINQSPNVDSLNLSVAVGITLRSASTI